MHLLFVCAYLSRIRLSLYEKWVNSSFLLLCTLKQASRVLSAASFFVPSANRESVLCYTQHHMKYAPTVQHQVLKGQGCQSQQQLHLGPRTRIRLVICAIPNTEITI